MTSFLNEIVDSNSGLFISGQPGTGSGKEFPLINPANGQTLGILAEANADDVDKAVKSARHAWRSEEHTSELQSRGHLVCRLLLEKKKDEDHEARPRELPPQESE